MDSNGLRKYAPVILRVGLALVFLWFGIEQVFYPYEWTGWLPEYARALPFQPTTLVFLNGLFETIFGALLFAGLYTRLAASLLSLHMAHIVTVVGYGEIGVRDFALFTGVVTEAFFGADEFTADAFFARRKSRA